jgi:hypothetical protein
VRFTTPSQDGFPLFQGVIAAYIQGVEDEKCSAVSLSALRGFSAVIPVLPASRVNHTTDLISLKVQISGYRHLVEIVTKLNGKTFLLIEKKPVVRPHFIC